MASGCFRAYSVEKPGMKLIDFLVSFSSQFIHSGGCRIFLLLLVSGQAHWG
jgi:hypothetical protein